MKKINLSVLILLLVTISAISFIGAEELSSGNITILTPLANAVLNGSAYEFNCSMGDAYENFTDGNWTRVRVYLHSASLTANTTGTALGDYFTNTSATAGDFNGTINTLAVEDANDYTFTCQIWNGTTHVNQTRSGITVDNTEPQAATNLAPANPDSGESLAFSGVVVGVNTTSCTLYFDGINPGASSYTMTHSGNNCSYAFTSTIPEQSYRWYIRASDESNTTDSSIQTTKVDVTTGAGKSMTPQQLSKAKAFSLIGEDGLIKNPFLLMIIVAIIVLVVRSISKR